MIRALLQLNLSQNLIVQRIKNSSSHTVCAGGTEIVRWNSSHFIEVHVVKVEK